jgi:hypothetical protein
MAGLCEHGDEPLGSTKGGKLLDYLSVCYAYQKGLCYAYQKGVCSLELLLLLSSSSSSSGYWRCDTCGNVAGQTPLVLCLLHFTLGVSCPGAVVFLGNPLPLNICNLVEQQWGM